MKLLPRIFYGWWIVAGGFILQALGGGLLFNSFGAYFVYLQADFGWSRTLISGAFSMARLESGFLGPIQGWLINKLGPQAVIRIGVVIFGGGFILLSRMDDIPTFYGSFLLMTIGSTLAGFLTVNIVLANWFERRRARAMALGAMGQSVAGLLVPLVAWALSTFQWRATALYSALLVVVLGFPVAQLFRHAPEPYGLAPDGRLEPGSSQPGQPERPGSSTTSGANSVFPSRPARAQHPKDSSTARRSATASGGALGLSAREALRTPAFWLLTSGHTAALFAVSAVIVHLIPYLVEQLHMSVEGAATVFAGLTALSVVGQLLAGYLGDRLEKRLICAACMIGHTMGLLILILSTSLLPVVVGALLHGLAWGTRGPLMMAIRADYFGRRSFATIEGFASMVTTLGLFLAPLVVGFIADRVGDYRPGFGLMACVTAAGFFCFFMARRPPLPHREASTLDT